jgi:hypothetical protein
MKCLAYLPGNECYLNLPADSAVDNPLDIEMIKEQQDADNNLQRQATKYADRYVRKSLGWVLLSVKLVLLHFLYFSCPVTGSLTF